MRRLQRWTAPENMDKLVEIGKAAADRIEDKHFGRGFDIE